LLERLRGAARVECRLQTGRQHQIRIHMSEDGHPVVGEPVYMREYEGPVIEAPRPMLHARHLGFEHPRTGEWLEFDDPPPEDFAALCDALRG
jgi:23S rRNA pseudouridine1911/1915/1917 synthase